MRQRRTIRVLALLATLLLTTFGIASLATPAHASSAHRLATLRAAEHPVTHGQNVVTKSAHADQHHDAVQHGLDSSLPPTGHSTLRNPGRHTLDAAEGDVAVVAAARSHDGRAPPAVL